MSHWCISRSPLMVGCDLPSSPPETLQLLTNADVLAAHRASRHNRELLRDGHLVLCGAGSTTADHWFVAVFNTGTGGLARSIPHSDPGLPAGEWAAREAWSGMPAAITTQGAGSALAVDVPAHGVQFYRFTRS